MSLYYNNDVVVAVCFGVALYIYQVGALEVVYHEDKHVWYAYYIHSVCLGATFSIIAILLRVQCKYKESRLGVKTLFLL